MQITTVVFDAYGTLFDVTGAARIAASEPGAASLLPLWPRLAEDWRRKQLEYSWLRAITGDHVDFGQVTADALDWAMEAAGLADPALRARLLALYDRLPAFPEVPQVLGRLRGLCLRTAILSNGSPAMLASAVSSAGIGPDLDAVISAEEAGVFKPHAAVYSLVGKHFGTRPDQVLFVSSNGWDAAGAAGFGFTTLWVNRAGLPVDRLSHRPATVGQDLTALTKMVSRS